jgi:hypothetical protein
VKKTSKRTSGSRKRSPAPSRDAPARVLAAFADLAKREGLRWYVFGAQAVNLYGFPRATADLDVTADLAGRDPREIVAALARAGFAARFHDPDFVAVTRVIPLVHRRTRFPIDLVLAGPGLEQLFLDDARVHRVGGRDVPVISPDHLVVTKLIAGRSKDLDDIRELLALAAVDVKKVDALLAEVEQALGQSDLRPLFRELRSARRRGSGSRRPRARRRRGRGRASRALARARGGARGRRGRGP